MPSPSMSTLYASGSAQPRVIQFREILYEGVQSTGGWKEDEKALFLKEAGMLHCVHKMLVIFHHLFVASAAYFAVVYGRPVMALVTKIDRMKLLGMGLWLASNKTFLKLWSRESYWPNCCPSSIILTNLLHHLPDWQQNTISNRLIRTRYSFNRNQWDSRGCWGRRGDS